MKILSFIFSVLIIRNLGAGAYGQYAAVLAFTGAFAVLSDLGLGVYAVRQVARWRDEPSGQEHAESLFADVVLLRLLLSLLTAILLVLSAWATGRPVMLVAAIGLNSLSLFIYAVQAGSDMLLSGYERMDITARVKIVNQLAFVVIGAIVLYLGFGYLGLIVANLLAISLMTIMTWRGVRRINLRFGKPTPAKWLRLLRASLPFGIIGLALGLSYKFDTIMLSVFRNDLETGYYNAAYNLVFSAFVISGTINSSVYPSLTREYSSNGGSLSGILERILRYLFIISLPIAFGVWALSEELVRFLYDVDFLATAPALKIVIWTIPFMYASDLLGYIVLIMDREKQAARAVLVSTGFNVLLNFLLVPRFGYLVAAGMTVATEVVLVGQYVGLLWGQLRVLDWSVILVRPFAAAAIMAFAVVSVRGVLPFFGSILVGVLVYIFLTLLLRSVGNEELNFLISMLGKRVPVVKPPE